MTAAPRPTARRPPTRSAPQRQRAPGTGQGRAIAGIASTPIASIIAGSTVNGAPGNLGAAGNPRWRGGRLAGRSALNPAPAQSPPPQTCRAGTYTLATGCATSVTPPSCANSTATVTVTALAGGALFLDKTASTTTAEIGQSVQYRLRVRNSGTNTVTDVKLADELPMGFKLIPGTVQIGLEPATPTKAADPAGTPGPALTFSLGSIGAGAVVDIYYQVRVGVGADRGDGINRAQAKGVGATSGLRPPR